MKTWLLISILFLLGSAGCQPSLSRHGRIRPFQESSFFADHSSARPWPEGVVPRSAVQEDEPPPSRKSLLRGQEQYRIYCSVCHGLDGQGNGMAVQRGFPSPPSYLEDRLMRSPTSHFYQVITEGRGRMFAYANRVSPPDRWAIAQYIRVLQLQQNFPARWLTADDKRKLQESSQ